MKYQTPAVTETVTLDGSLFDDVYSLKRCVDNCDN